MEIATSPVAVLGAPRNGHDYHATARPVSAVPISRQVYVPAPWPCQEGREWIDSAVATVLNVKSKGR